MWRHLQFRCEQVINCFKGEAITKFSSIFRPFAKWRRESEPFNYQGESWIIGVPPRSNCKWWVLTQTIEQHNNWHAWKVGELKDFTNMYTTYPDRWIKWWKDGQMERRIPFFSGPCLGNEPFPTSNLAHFCKLVSAKTLESMQPWSGQNCDLKCNRSKHFHRNDRNES